MAEELASPCAAARSVAGHPGAGRPSGDRLRRLRLQPSIRRFTVDRDFNHLHDHLDLRAVLPSIRIGLIDKDGEVVCSPFAFSMTEKSPDAPVPQASDSNSSPVTLN